MQDNSKYRYSLLSLSNSLLKWLVSVPRLLKVKWYLLYNFAIPYIYR
jgi:hypothetical protein